MSTFEVVGRKVLREPEVKRRTGRCRTQRWRDCRAGRFPLPVELGPNAIGWFEDEIDAWLADRPRRRYSAPEAARCMRQRAPHLAAGADRALNGLLPHIRKQAAEAELPDDLCRRVEEQFEDQPELPWDTAIAEILKGRRP